MRALILRLEGPLMSFGHVAVDEIRPTRQLPGRSMLTGLLANALGWEHGAVDALDRLQARLRFAARQDRAGSLLRDYQTAELAKRDLLWTSRGRPAGRDGGEASYGGPVLRQRFYLADAAVTVAVALEPEAEAPDLDALAKALRRPARPLFLGRKGCPPAVPLLERIVEASTLVAAVGEAEPSRTGQSGQKRFLVETEDMEGEPEGRLVELADRRDWRLGFHAGQSRRRELFVSAGAA
ncbi:type I-E CRISPR-associated protein Cas5/CasD [Marinimicrococcus flavescens]|uniref:Type I-E CRISPR-associated protein Cas5/CasD n=1 Tax=Marinimicrococcus flavescens TaxID=3031815 RepID=A0AAP3XRC8_9PROT|nr:type I-E CRISPR-associated protein Cas5/CasD [Marinimicrococcus flavescens]